MIELVLMDCRGSSAWRRVGVWTLFVAGCGGQTQDRAASPSAAARTEAAVASEALVRARGAKAEAEKIAPPAVPANLNRQMASEFLRGPLLAWVSARTRASEAAARAYGLVIVPGNAEELAGLLELGSLWQAFGEQLQSAVIASVPAEFAFDKAAREAYLSAILSATRRPFTEAYAPLQRCAALPAEGRNGQTIVACKERLARLSPGGSSSGERESGAVDREPTRAEPQRPSLPGSQPASCVFAGTLTADSFKIWSDPRTRLTVARVRRLDLASLTLPEKETGPVRVAATWPIQGQFGLDAAALPLVLKTQQDLVKDHIWLDAGTPVQAFEPRDGSAEVIRPRGWTRGSQPVLARRIACSQLALSGAIEQSYRNEKNLASFSGLVKLSAAPGEAPIAELQLATPALFQVLAQRGAWRRIDARASAQSLPFSFDAWTQSRSSEDASLGMIGLLQERNPTHVSKQPLRVFVLPSANAPTITLAAEVWFRAGAPQLGFVPIELSHLRGPEKEELWVQQGDLARSARALER